MHRGIRLSLATLILALGITAVACAENRGMLPPLVTVGPLSPALDGRLAEEAWEAATPVLLLRPDGSPSSLVSCKLGYDDIGLVLAWRVTGPTERERRGRDADLSAGDWVEVLLAADENAPVYHFAVSTAGDRYDARDGDTSWDGVWRGLSLVAKDYWQVEMQIPWACLEAAPPVPGELWRLNLRLRRSSAEPSLLQWAGAPEHPAAAVPGLLRISQMPSPVSIPDFKFTDGGIVLYPSVAAGSGLQAELFDGEEVVASARATDTEALTIAAPRPGVFRLRLIGVDATGEPVLHYEMRLERRPPLAVRLLPQPAGSFAIGLHIESTGLERVPDAYSISAPSLDTITLKPGPGPLRPAETVVDLSSCPVGELALTVTALADDVELARQIIPLVLPESPAWLGNNGGQEDLLLRPWVPVTVEGAMIRYAGGLCDFGDGPLPERLTVGSIDVLAAPISVRLSVDGIGQRLKPARVRWREVTDAYAVATVTAQSELAQVRVVARCEFNGLVTLQMRVNPRGDRQLDGVELIIPVATQGPALMMVSGGAGEEVRGAAPQSPWEAPFAPAVWLGDHESGIQWLCASKEGWSVEDAEAVLSLQRGKERTSLVVTMVDQPLAPGASFESRFAVQATPTLPRSSRPELRTAFVSADEAQKCGGVQQWLAMLRDDGVDTVVLADERFQPRPEGLEAPAAAELSALLDAAQELELRVMLTVDVDALPAPPGTVRRAAPASGEGQSSGERAGAQGWRQNMLADYLAAAIARVMDDYVIAGVYLRGLSTPVENVTASREGNGEEDEEAVLPGDFGAAYQMIRRLRNVIHVRRPGGLLILDDSAGLIAPTASLADAVVCAATDATGRLLAPEAFAASCGPAGGLPVHVPLSAEDPELTAGALGLVLLHGVSPQATDGGEGLAAAADVWRLRDDFDVKGAAWVPYWSRPALLSTNDRDVLVSAYVRRREALAALVNCSHDSRIVVMSYDRRALGLSRWLHALDLLGGERITQIGESVRLRLGPLQAALVHLQDREMEAETSDE